MLWTRPSFCYIWAASQEQHGVICLVTTDANVIDEISTSCRPLSRIELNKERSYPSWFSYPCVFSSVVVIFENVDWTILIPISRESALVILIPYRQSSEKYVASTGSEAPEKSKTMNLGSVSGMTGFYVLPIESFSRPKRWQYSVF